MPFQKGKSGNPNGRPPKKRALTELLEKAGNKTIAIDGKNIAKKRFLSNAIWQAITEKKIVMPDGTEMLVGVDDWWDAVQFVYKHIDGPPRQEIDLSTNEPLSITIVKASDEVGNKNK